MTPEDQTQAFSHALMRAVVEFQVDAGEQWNALAKAFPGVVYFATDLDPRSFDYDEARDLWLGRAELLLSAPGQIRPGQFEEVSFTLPARVVLVESGGEFSVRAFDFWSVEEDE